MPAPDDYQAQLDAIQGQLEAARGQLSQMGAPLPTGVPSGGTNLPPRPLPEDFRGMTDKELLARIAEKRAAAQAEWDRQPFLWKIALGIGDMLPHTAEDVRQLGIQADLKLGPISYLPPQLAKKIPDKYLPLLIGPAGKIWWATNQMATQMMAKDPHSMLNENPQQRAERLYGEGIQARIQRQQTPKGERKFR